jgi:hypothetical protein
MAIHTNLAAGKWETITLTEQLANIGSEIGRVSHWQRAKDVQQKRLALKRALELMRLTISDHRWPNHRKKEIVVLRSVVRDTFMGKNRTHTRPKTLEAYFMPFALQAASKMSQHL